MAHMNIRAGMEQRRTRILDEARSLLASENPDAFNIRNLAACSDITVPTIYNLVGNKEAVLLSICNDIVEQSKLRRGNFLTQQPLKVFEDTIRRIIEERSEHHELYRAVYIAWDQLGHSRQYISQLEEIKHQVESNFAEIFLHAQKQGSLLGRIPLEILAEQFFRSIHDHGLDWAYRRNTIEEFERRMLIDLYVSLSADANDSLRDQLIKKIRRLHKP